MTTTIERTFNGTKFVYQVRVDGLLLRNAAGSCRSFSTPAAAQRAIAKLGK